MLTFGVFRNDFPVSGEIKQARLANGLTQKEAAWVIGVEPQTWVSWESGKNKMRANLWDYWRIKVAMAAKQRVNIPDQYRIRMAVYEELQKRPRELWAVKMEPVPDHLKLPGEGYTEVPVILDKK